MPTTLADNRKYLLMTEADADAIFAAIAQMETECAAIEAVAEERIAEIKRETENATAVKRAEITRKAAELEAYINANQARFIKPRARKTIWGEYGRRTVTNIQISNEEELKAFATIHNRRDLIEVVTELDKKGIGAAIAKGETLPGAAKVTGERSFYKTAKALIDRARENAKTVESLSK